MQVIRFTSVTTESNRPSGQTFVKNPHFSFLQFLDVVAEPKGISNRTHIRENEKILQN